MVTLSRLLSASALIAAAVETAYAAEFTFSLPATNNLENSDGSNGNFVHGLCIMDATNFGATVSPDLGFYYNSVPDFGDGILPAPDKPPAFLGVDGLGAQACEGGTFLQPSNFYGPRNETDITVHADTVNGSPLTFCVFVEQSFTYLDIVRNRGGRWEPFLLEEGFTPSAPFTRWIADWISYCKTFDPETDPTYFDLDTTLPPGELTPCPGDIEVIHTDGVTPFPDGSGAVSIVAQDTSTVTVDLKQSWAASVEKYFYSYNEGVYNYKCYEELGVAPGELIDTITIQCNVLSPIAELHICLQDTTNSLLTSGDKGTVPKCCNANSEDGTATVCYQLVIECDTTC